MAIHLPRLSTDRLKRRGDAPADSKPFALFAKEGNAFVLTAVDARTEEMGLHAGTPLADARAIRPDLVALEADDAADTAFLERIADWCDRFTPVVVLDPPHGLFLDVTGCAHLFGGEAALLGAVEAGLARQGLTLRAAIAPTPGAAFAMARYSRVQIADESGLKSALAPLPLAALRLAPEATALLKRLGLRRIGQIMEGPREPFAARAGAGAMRRLDQALGRAGEVLTPRRPAADIFAFGRLAEPIFNLDAVLIVVDALCTDLCADLEKRAAGARMLRLVLFAVDGQARTLDLGLSSPAREAARLLRLFREKLGVAPERLEAEFGFEAARLDALEIASLVAEAIDLAGAQESDPQAAARLVDALSARLAPARVGKVILKDAHLPERASGWSAPDASGATPPAAPRDATPRRPLRLFEQAQRIEAIASVPDGPPARFRWRRVLHEITHAEGPERLAPDWLNGKSKKPRDYYRVEDKEGRRFWLYRDGLYDGAEPPQWFLHGLFS